MAQKQQEIANLEMEIFTPALQGAVKAASERQAKVVDIISAAANAYMNMLTVLTGSRGAAAEMIQAQAQFLKTSDNAPSESERA